MGILGRFDNGLRSKTGPSGTNRPGARGYSPRPDGAEAVPLVMPMEPVAPVFPSGAALVAIGPDGGGWFAPLVRPENPLWKVVRVAAALA